LTIPGIARGIREVDLPLPEKPRSIILISVGRCADSESFIQSLLKIVDDYSYQYVCQEYTNCHELSRASDIIMIPSFYLDFRGSHVLLVKLLSSIRSHLAGVSEQILLNTQPP